MNTIPLTPLLPAAALAAGLTWLVARLVGEWATRRQILDVPNARSSHRRPTPRLGGIGIVCGVAAGLMLASLTLEAALGWRLRATLAIGTALALASLADDLRGLSARTRLALHIAAAALSMIALDVLPRVAGTAGTAHAWLFVVVAAFWIVAFVNAFNFMDGIDGIAGGQACVAGLGWWLIGVLLGDAGVASAGLVIAGASVGFLLLNWSPARIFMGDVGSAFLGFMLAVVPLIAEDPVRAALPALLVVWPFLFDTGYTLLRRATRGENLLQPHRSHLYQRLTLAGWSHARVAASYIALAAAGLAPAAWLASARWTPGLLAAVPVAALAGLLVLTVWRYEWSLGEPLDR